MLHLWCTNLSGLQQRASGEMLRCNTHPETFVSHLELDWSRDSKCFISFYSSSAFEVINTFQCLSVFFLMIKSLPSYPDISLIPHWDLHPLQSVYLQHSEHERWFLADQLHFKVQLGLLCSDMCLTPWKNRKAKINSCKSVTGHQKRRALFAHLILSSERVVRLEESCWMSDSSTGWLRGQGCWPNTCWESMVSHTYKTKLRSVADRACRDRRG